MTYELPRTESGDVDWEGVYLAIDCACRDVSNFTLVDVIYALEQNARAEEREACAKFIDHKVMGYGDEFAKAIRARGESE